MGEIKPDLSYIFKNAITPEPTPPDTGGFDFYGITPTGGGPREPDYSRLDRRPYGASYFWDKATDENDGGKYEHNVAPSSISGYEWPWNELFPNERYSDLSERMDEWDSENLLKKKNSANRLNEAIRKGKYPAMTDDEFLQLGLQKIREYQPDFYWGDKSAKMAKLQQLGDEFEYSRKNHGNGLMPEGPWSYEPKGYRPFPIRTRAATPENSTKLFDLALGNLKGTPIYVNGDDIAKYYGKWASYPYSL